MDTILEGYFKIYSKLAPDLFNNDNWALLFLIGLFGVIFQLLAYLYVAIFKEIKDPQKRITILTTLTSIAAFLISLCSLWMNERLEVLRIIGCFLLSLFIWSFRYLGKLLGKDSVIDLKSDLKLKNQVNKKGILPCPGCQSFSIASINVAYTPQTCGDCERIIYLDRNAFRMFKFFWIAHGLLIFTFLFLKNSLNYWNVFLSWLFLAVIVGGIILFAFLMDRIKSKNLKIKSPS